MTFLKAFYSAFFILFSFLSPSLLSACAVCFGGAESNLRDGFFWGIVLLLSLPFILIAVIGGLIVKSSKRKQHV